MSANISSYKVAIITKFINGRQTWRARSGHGREEICEKQGSILSKTVTVVVVLSKARGCFELVLAFEQS